MKIEIKNKFTGSVIFEHDVNNNSIKLTVKAAIESNTNLRDANLYGANLRGADLRNCTGNKLELKTLQIDTYSIAFTDAILQIGCKQYTHKEWENFTDDEISKMDLGALDWWKKWKEFVFMAIRLSFGDERNVRFLFKRTLCNDYIGIWILG